MNQYTLLYNRDRYDSILSFSPIDMFSRGSPFLIVHSSLPAKTLREFLGISPESD